MRILNAILGDATGGRWQVVCDYSRILMGRGHPVWLLAGKNHIPDLTLVPAGVDIILIRNRGHYDYLASWSLRKRLRELAPDLVLAHCSRSVALLKRAAQGIVPVVAVSHSNKVKRLLPADAYIALTRHIQKAIENEAGMALHKPSFIVPNMVPVSTLPPFKVRRNGEPVTIGALGRFDAVKGLDVFIRALALLRKEGMPFRALLGGAGVEANNLKRLSQKLGLEEKIRFPGWVTDVDAFWAVIDILCVPARSDAFGLTPLQAATAGVPLVLSGAAGHREMFQEGSEALFCGIDDPHATARQLRTLAQDSDLAQRLRLAAFERVRNEYSEKAVTDRLIQALDSIANNLE